MDVLVLEETVDVVEGGITALQVVNNTGQTDSVGRNCDGHVSF